MDERQKKLSEIMRAKRKSLGLTQEDAAEHLKISSKWYQRVESGQSKPGFDLICELAKEFDINFADFTEDDKKAL